MSQIKGIEKVLIANRGEIAVRVARTLRQLGITSAAVVHEEDARTPFAACVDEACSIEGTTPVAAYLDAEQIIRIAREIGADAIHPGYGFLAENAAFAEAVENAGIRFIGPDSKAIRLMGDKIESRSFVASLGLPLTPSATEEDDPASFETRAAKVGFPLLIKASAGGGGKGMQIVRKQNELSAAIERARGEAKRYFADGRIYAERYIEQPRHIEVQILADGQGGCIHLGERDCSIQRRFQKLIEETPAPNLPESLRREICDQAVQIARAANYRNAGTVEFVLAPTGDFYFLEMNTRLQVEHPVTEMVTGIDLVEEQIRIAAGDPLRLEQADVEFSGASIECRICAEDADQDFRPAVGQVLLYRPPQDGASRDTALPGRTDRSQALRFESGIEAGQSITTAFDPMLAKLVVHAEDREAAIEKARTALRETVILGVTTNTAYLERILAQPEFTAGQVETGFIPNHERALEPTPLSVRDQEALIAAAALSDRDFLDRAQSVPNPHAQMGPWRN